MLVIRGTEKLRKRVKEPVAEPGDTSTTVLGDWFGTVLFWKPHVALLVNERTLVSVLLPLAPASTLPRRIPQAIAATLDRLGADPAFIRREIEAMSEVRIGKTNDPSVVSTMTYLGHRAQIVAGLRRGTLDEIAEDLADTGLGLGKGEFRYPIRELHALLEAESPTADDADLVVPSVVGAPPGVYQLKATIKGIRPPIWRRVLVDGTSTLHEVHEVLQAAFGWWNCHLYEFEFGRARYGIPDPDWDFGPPMRDARTTRLDQVASDGAAFTYTYDFGDDWEHAVTVEKVLDPSTVDAVPACLDGRRAGPPEDCGGVGGYQHFLEVLGDPTHPEHVPAREWATRDGVVYDPAPFGPTEFPHNLRIVRLTNFDDM